MDYLWTPWRYQYVQQKRPAEGCIFCSIPKENRDTENFVLHRAGRNFVMLNRYPYSTGHLMVVPFEHVATLGEAAKETMEELILLARSAEACLQEIFHPKGLNVGFNVGEAAGAGVAGHLHLHVVPRWTGDANFMSVIGETRVIPQALAETYNRLKPVWANSSL